MIQIDWSAALLAQFAETEDAQTANFTAWSCALAADAVDDFSLPVALAEREAGRDPDNVFHRENLGAVPSRSIPRSEQAASPELGKDVI